MSAESSRTFASAEAPEPATVAKKAYNNEYHKIEIYFKLKIRKYGQKKGKGKGKGKKERGEVDRPQMFSYIII